MPGQRSDEQQIPRYAWNDKLKTWFVMLKVVMEEFVMLEAEAAELHSPGRVRAPDPTRAD